MTLPTEPPSARPTSPAPTADRPPARQGAPSRRGCGSQLLGLIGWLLTLALSVALGIAALAAIAYFFFGFSLATPGQIRQASADVVTLQGQVRTLSTAAALSSTANVEAARDLASAGERLDELEGRLGVIEQQAADLAGQSATAAALAQELGENVALAATIQAEGREGQVLIAVVATVQADNTARLAELQRRTERISRFVSRLGDLAGDVGAEETPTPATAIATPTATPTATP